MHTDQPFFRFNPNAYAEGRSFKPSQEICEVCSRPCVWKYTGRIYGATEPSVCARCIAEDRLGTFLTNNLFSLHDIEIFGAEPALAKEVRQRTPGIYCFNPYKWPVLDRIPLAFLGYGEDEKLIAVPGARAAIEEAFAEFGWDFAPSPYALIYKELDGDRYCVVIDLD